MKTNKQNSKALKEIKNEKLVEVIHKMAEYVLETDKEKEWCNVRNCNYENSHCSEECIIRYFMYQQEEDYEI